MTLYKLQKRFIQDGATIDVETYQSMKTALIMRQKLEADLPYNSGFMYIITPVEFKVKT